MSSIRRSMIRSIIREARFGRLKARIDAAVARQQKAEARKSAAVRKATAKRAVALADKKGRVERTAERARLAEIHRRGEWDGKEVSDRVFGPAVEAQP